ncbi:MAG: GNAT family N-acetyltransferase [Polyangiaceae bacterium]
MGPVEPPILRRATRDDVPALLELLADDDKATHPERHGPAAGLDAYLAAFDDIARDPLGGLWVAELEGRVVGTFQLMVLRHLANGGARVAQVESVHVRSHLRGRGIGARMMRFAVDEARRLGCHRVQLTSNKARAEAHRFYGRLGFTASHEGFKMKLSR